MSKKLTKSQLFKLKAQQQGESAEVQAARLYNQRMAEQREAENRLAGKAGSAGCQEDVVFLRKQRMDAEMKRAEKGDFGQEQQIILHRNEEKQGVMPVRR